MLGKTETAPTLEWLEGQRRSLETERKAVQGQIEIAERSLYTSATEDELTLKAQEEAYVEVQQLQENITRVRQHRDEVTLAIADSALFIANLERKIAALNDSTAVSEHIGEVEFSVCPVCYSAVSAPDSVPTGSCYLCKTPLSSEAVQTRLVAMINDAAIQLKQSRSLQAKREELSHALDGELRSIQQDWNQASQRLRSLQRLPSSSAREELRALHRRSGYLDRQVEDLEEKFRLSQLVAELSQRKEDLNAAITGLRTQNEQLRAAQQRRLSYAYTLIADEIRNLLSHDLRRQDSFESPQSIEFSFADNKITVDGHTYFSASSRVILKSSFFVGFFAASTKDALFRYPRFCILDTIEDKGMEPERSHNFQNLILEKSRSAPVEHQIIYATAMISPELDDEEFTVGKFSTRDDPTLDIRA